MRDGFTVLSRLSGKARASGNLSGHGGDPCHYGLCIAQMSLI
jgi:hypothetical protein